MLQDETAFGRVSAALKLSGSEPAVMYGPRNEPAPVLFVHHGGEWIRGSERVLLDLLDHLDRERFPPVVWCNAETMAKEIRQRGIPVHCDQFTILFDYVPPRFELGRYLHLVREGRRLVREHGIRLIHANSGAPNQWMLPVARAARIPLLVHLHAVYALRDRITLGLHQASLAACVSQAVAAGLLEDGGTHERARIIYNGVSVGRITQGSASRLREELDIPADAVVATQVGSLIHRKGWDVLFDAVAMLRDESPPIHLLVVGDGPEREALVQRVAAQGLGERVHFLGERPDPGAIYRDASDIAVLASRDEAFPLSPLEAAMLSMPVIGTRAGGTPETMQEGVTGVLVPPEDPAALAAALRTLATDPDLRRRLGSAARVRALSRYTVEQNAAAFHAVYAELLARPARQYGWRGAWATPRIYTKAAAAVLGRRLTRLRTGRWSSAA